MTLKQLNEKIEQMFDMKTTNKMISIRTIGERKYKETCNLYHISGKTVKGFDLEYDDYTRQSIKNTVVVHVTLNKE